MTTKPSPTDEDLMAYADGALPKDRSDEIGALVVADPRLQNRVEMYRRSRDLVKRAIAPLAEEPVPDALRRAIESKIAAAGSGPPEKGTVISFPPPAARKPSPRWVLPLAASFAAVAMGLAGYGIGSGFGPAGGAQYALNEPLRGGLANALGRQASGEEVSDESGRIRSIASFRDRDNILCREFEVDAASGGTVMGLACRDGDLWRLRIAVAAPQAATGYAPASSNTVIESYLTAIEAGEPLTADEERAALSK